MPGEACDILIVDDQPGVRRLLFEAFVDQGLRVDTASAVQRLSGKQLQQLPCLFC